MTTRPAPHHAAHRLAELTALADRLHATGQPGLGEEFDRVAAEHRAWAAERAGWRAEVQGLRARLARAEADRSARA